MVCSLLLTLLLVAPIEDSATKNLFDYLEQEQEQSRVASFEAVSQLEAAATTYVTLDKQWQLEGIQSIGDALAFQPNVWVYQLNGREFLTIRGFAVREGVGNLIDGVPTASLFNRFAYDLAGGFDALSLKRIETLRGPNSTLYGTSAFHGIVVSETWDSDQDTLEFESSFGTGLYHNAALRTRQSLARDKVHIVGIATVSGQRDNQQKYRYRDADSNSIVFNRLSQERETVNVIAKLQYEDSFELGAYTSYKILDGYHASGRVGLPSGTQGGSKHRHYILNAKGKWKPNDASEFSAQGYFRYEIGRNFSGLNQGVREEALESILEDISVGAKLRWKQQFTLDKVNLRYTVGYDFLWSDIIFLGSRIFDSGNDFSTAADPSQWVHALMTQGVATFFDDRLRVEGGLRFDYYQFTGEHFSPRAGLIYKFSERIAIKLLYGHSFRAPSAAEAFVSQFNLDDPDDQTFVADESLEPEVLNSGELVVQGGIGPVDGSLRGFYSELGNQISLRSVATANAAYENVGRSRAYGAELEGNLTLSPIRLSLSASYAQSEELEPSFSATQVFPNFQANVQLSYHEPKIGLLLNLVSRSAFKFVSGAGEFRSPEALEPYWRVDLTASWRPQEVFKKLPFSGSIFVNALNLFNRNNERPSLFEMQFGEQDRAFTFYGGVRLQWKPPKKQENELEE